MASADWYVTSSTLPRELTGSHHSDDTSDEDSDDDSELGESTDTDEE